MQITVVFIFFFRLIILAILVDFVTFHRHIISRIGLDLFSVRFLSHFFYYFSFFCIWNEHQARIDRAVGQKPYKKHLRPFLNRTAHSVVSCKMRLQNVASANGSGRGRGRRRSRRCLWPASWVALSLHREAGCVCPLLLRLLKTLVVTSKCRTFVCYNMHSIYTLAFNGTLNGKFHNIYTRAHTHTQTPQCTLWVWPVLSWKFNWQHAVGKVIIVFLSIAINVCRYANFALFYFMQYSF